MEPDLGSMDLFCRINVQTDMPLQELVAFIARCSGGSSHMNAVRGRSLDISVFENDDFDTEKSHSGEDRWLHFRYTLEVDPVAGQRSRSSTFPFTPVPKAAICRD